MSIADKITSIEGHLTDDYEGLENLGADLTNVNKNIQNIRTCLDNIYTNLPKTTGEGSNLSLNTLKGRINVDDILGDTEQEGTPTPSTPQDINVVTGTQEVKVENKNLFKIEEASATRVGIECTINGSEVLLNGTSTGGGFVYNSSSKYMTIPKGTYEMSSTLLSGSATQQGDTAIYLKNKSTNATICNIAKRFNYRETQTITFEEDTEIYVQVYTNQSGNILNNLKVGIQLEKRKCSYCLYTTPRTN